jgi:hypothetical protein
MNNFLPEGYDKIPSTGRFMRLQEGVNVFRVLGSTITGWEYWSTGNKPVRLKDRPSGRPLDIRTEDDSKENVKHFWAFPVWNYTDKTVQILEVTQVQIQEGIKSLVDDQEWGDPKGYDIKITRSGTGFETKYVTQGRPHSPMDPKIAEEYTKAPVNLAALYDGGNPFASRPAAEEAVDGPGYQEPAIPVDPPPPGSRYGTVPEQFKPKKAA